MPEAKVIILYKILLQENFRPGFQEDKIFSPLDIVGKDAF